MRLKALMAESGNRFSLGDAMNSSWSLPHGEGQAEICGPAHRRTERIPALKVGTPFAAAPTCAAHVLVVAAACTLATTAFGVRGVTRWSQPEQRS